MANPIAKVLVVMTMLVAFIGQAFAYSTMHCDMSKTAHEKHVMADHSVMESMHTMHMMEKMSHGEASEKSANQQDECCGITCACPTNACNSIHIVNSQSFSLKIAQSLAVISHTNAVFPNANLKSLYRPPIFA